ncbi:MAG: septum formation initiator family protein [Hydrogenophilaceae bacterium]|jgi:cell division protein FtsB|nr:septum formation initiator family protein [Hydrogenophilaceae bacterium]
MNERARSLALSVGLGAAALYLAAHAVTGRQGLMAQWELQGQEKALRAELAALQTERAALDARAARLRPESLDLDYLDEKARALLAAGGPDEIVFSLDQDGPPPS